MFNAKDINSFAICARNLHAAVFLLPFSFGNDLIEQEVSTLLTSHFYLLAHALSSFFTIRGTLQPSKVIMQVTRFRTMLSSSCSYSFATGLIILIDFFCSNLFFSELKPCLTISVAAISS